VLDSDGNVLISGICCDFKSDENSMNSNSKRWDC
jgi:hypothetical protein